MDSPNSEAAEAPQVVFRRGKKRKMYRQRGETEGDVDSNTAAIPSSAVEEIRGKEPPTNAAGGSGVFEASRASGAPSHQRRAGKDEDEEEEEEGGMSVTEVLRLRNARKSKLRGVELREDAGARADADQNAAAAEEDGADGAEKLRARAAVSTEAIVGGVTKRFAPQIGLVGEIVNRHMEEYIESELAKRQPGLSSADGGAAAAANNAYADFTSASQQHAQDRSSSELLLSSSSGLIAPGTDGTALRGEGSQVPALRGKLHEVDLGTQSRALNIARTERVRRILRGEAAVVADSSGGDASDGNGDGKGGSSSRARRGSDDALRDQMVEDFLRENKLDVYDTEDAEGLAGDQSLPADERVAEQFRREFMLAMSQSRRRRRAQRPVNAHFAKGQKRPGAKKEHEILRGPKLGGSRNERAAMRDILLKQENEKRAAAARR